MRELLKSKIHKAVVTESNPDYEGSIGIDKDLMDKAEISKYEKVLVISKNTGERLETYAFPEEKNSGKISINGGAAKKIGTNEKIIILSFGLFEDEIKPKKALVDDENRFIKFH